VFPSAHAWEANRGVAMKIVFFGLVMTCALALVTQGAAAGDSAKGATGQVVVIQAAPGMTIDLSIDGRTVSRTSHVGDVLGPYRLTSGAHEVRFTQTDGGAPIVSTLKVRPGSNSDVVLHLPSERGGEPVVNSYRTPLSAIGPGKARVLVAHTANVAPADVRFDGKTVFQDIANGEFAQADVPDGTHKVALLPTGLTSKPLLGPLDVTLKQRTVTMVYAVGTPMNGSMNVITHTIRLAPDGTIAPRTVKTGSAGLGSGIRVNPFSSPSWSRPTSKAGTAHFRSSMVDLLLLLCGAGTAPQ
jgi:hypothetical protein